MMQQPPYSVIPREVAESTMLVAVLPGFCDYAQNDVSYCLNVFCNSLTSILKAND